MIDNTAFGELDAAGTLRFERLLPGPIERGWAYLTEPALLAAWIAPFPIPTTPESVRIFAPPHTLEFAWNEANAPDGPIIDTLLRFELSTAGGDVLLVLTHRALPAHARISVGAGWHAHLDALIAHANAQPAIDPETRYAVVAAAYREYFGSLT